MKPRTVIRTILLILCIGIFLFSGYKLYTIYNQYEEADQDYDALADRYVTPVRPAPDHQQDQYPTEDQETTDPSQEPAEPQETAPIAVDFAALREDSKYIVAWLYSEDTPINYPVVQSDDNEYFLRKLPDGKYSYNGSIFMDYRCSSNFSDYNTILYGHNMKNSAMFGSFTKYKKQAYYEEHPVMYLLTNRQNYKIELFAGYTTESTAGDTYGFPDTSEERDVLIEKALRLSTFQADVEIDEDDRIITLSTCTYDYDDARYVLVGVLREIG